MKKTISIISLLCAFSFGMAQVSIFDAKDNAPRFGMHISWNLSSPSTSLNSPISTYQNGSGVSAGAFYNIPLYKNLYFEPGLSFFYNTMIINQDIVEDIKLDYPLTPEGSLRNCGFSIPLSFGYRFDFTDNISLAVFTGPQFNMGVTLKQYINKGKTSHNLYSDGWRRFDTQWQFGIRFYYSDNWIAQISGGIGMTDLLKSKASHPYFRRNSFSIGVGYIF